MTIDQDKEDLDRAIELLKEAYDKLQEEYHRGWGEWEYKAEKFLNEIENGRDSNIEPRGK